jgi:hypothetical protein
MKTLRAFYTMMSFGEGMKALAHVYEEAGYTGAMIRFPEMLEEVARAAYFSPVLVSEAHIFLFFCPAVPH